VTYSDKNPDRKSQLRFMQTLAVGMLCLATLFFVLAHYMHGRHPAWGYLGAFAEAAMVGAFADWFAVVALFRRPLGLPIPHTAIIPNSKDRIADSLAEFVRDHFLSHDKVLELLKKFNLAEHLTSWLRDATKVDRFVNEARHWMLGLLNTLDDEHIALALSEALAAQALRWDAASTLGDVLELVTKDNRHQEVLDAGLEKFAEVMAQTSVRARVGKEINEFLQSNYPKWYWVADKALVGSSMESVAQSLSGKLTGLILSRLDSVLTDASHPWRKEYSEWLSEYMVRLRKDPTLRSSFNDVKNRLVQDTALNKFMMAVWGDIKQKLSGDLASDESVLGRYASAGLRGMGERLSNDNELQESINQHIYHAVGSATESLREGVTQHISGTIKAWDDRQLVQELELSVGRDLQFIRINGTLVGGLAGLLIYSIAQFG